MPASSYKSINCLYLIYCVLKRKLTLKFAQQLEENCNCFLKTVSVVLSSILFCSRVWILVIFVSSSASPFYSCQSLHLPLPGVVVVVQIDSNWPHRMPLCGCGQGKIALVGLVGCQQLLHQPKFERSTPVCSPSRAHH